MKTSSRWLALAGLVLMYVFSTAHLAAQQGGGRQGGRGDFDPEQFRERMMERFREQLEVKSDDEWKLIQGRIEKVMEARQASGPGFRGFGGRRGGGGPGGGPDGPGGGGRRGFGGEPDPAVEALQAAIESNASAADIKAKLAKVRESRKANEEALLKAQKELAAVLSVKQEAQAYLMGLVP